MKNRLATIARRLDYTAVVEHQATHADVFVEPPASFCLEVQLWSTPFRKRRDARRTLGADMYWLIRDALNTPDVRKVLFGLPAVRFRVIDKVNHRPLTPWDRPDDRDLARRARLEVWGTVAFAPASRTSGTTPPQPEPHGSVPDPWTGTSSLTRSCPSGDADTNPRPSTAIRVSGYWRPMSPTTTPFASSNASSPHRHHSETTALFRHRHPRSATSPALKPRNLPADLVCQRTSRPQASPQPRPAKQPRLCLPVSRRPPHAHGGADGASGNASSGNMESATRAARQRRPAQTREPPSSDVGRAPGTRQSITVVLACKTEAKM